METYPQENSITVPDIEKNFVGESIEQLINMNCNVCQLLNYSCLIFMGQLTLWSAILYVIWVFKPSLYYRVISMEADFTALFLKYSTFSRNPFYSVTGWCLPFNSLHTLGTSISICHASHAIRLSVKFRLSNITNAELSVQQLTVWYKE